MGNGPLPNFHHIATAVAARRSAVPLDASGPRGEPTGKYGCPQCGERYVVEATCDRCEVPLVDVERTLIGAPQPERAIRSRGATVPMRFVAAAWISACVVAPYLIFQSELDPLVRGALLFAMAPIVIALGCVPALRALARRGERLRVEKRRRSIEEVPVTHAGDARPEPALQARVRGRLEFEQNEGALAPVLVDERGGLRVRVAVRVAPSIFDAAREGVAREGDLIDCVGPIEPRTGDANGYRERALDVEIEARSIWVVERKR